jgi:AraC-like DNA-binding protein
MATFDANRPDFTPYGFTCVRWSPQPALRVDHHNELELNFLTSGWVVYLFGGRKVRIEAGRFTAFWAAIPHQVIEIGTAEEYFVGTIPMAWFLRFRLPDGFVQRLFRGEVLMAGDTARAHLDGQLCAQWVADMAKPGPVAMHIVALEFEARLRRLAEETPPNSEGTRNAHGRPGLSEVGLSKVERMACLIGQRYLDRLTVDEIGRAVGLHPVYAASLFKRTFGTTLSEYTTYHRVSHAQHLLATTRDSIVDVAFASGFNSISRFNAAFRRDCNCTPTEYRARHATLT